MRQGIRLARSRLPPAGRVGGWTLSIGIPREVHEWRSYITASRWSGHHRCGKRRLESEVSQIPSGGQESGILNEVSLIRLVSKSLRDEVDAFLFCITFHYHHSWANWLDFTRWAANASPRLGAT